MTGVRRAEIKDIPTIMKFMDDYWLNGYALANNREYFEWQFVKDGKVNIWIGIDDETGEMFAMQGAVVYSDSDNPDISGILWVAKKSKDPLLAFSVIDLMWEELRPRYCASPGIAPRVAKLNRSLGYDVISMDHYYRLGDLKDYKIALVKEKRIPHVHDMGYSFEHVKNMDDFKEVIPEKDLIQAVPSKNYNYISWRYFKHPIYSYDVWKILNSEGKPEGILITREEKANDRKSCKIVDFYGDSRLFERITAPIDRLVADKEYEYIDVYSFGVPVEIYDKGGFIKCDPYSENIITNLFQPFTQKNTEILMVNPGIPSVRIFRGDGDQDKPRF